MLYKNALIKIKKSFGRYISLLIIVFVGVGFYAGIQSSAPDYISLADEYYRDSDMFDFKIMGAIGLTDADLSEIEGTQGVEMAVGSYSMDVLESDKAIRLHAIEEDMNKVLLVSGHMPEAENECLADEKFYNVGDTITIENVNGRLKNNQFTVTGCIQSVFYLSCDYGGTTVGDGRLTSFVFIPKANFGMPVFTEIYVAMEGSKGHTAYSDGYKDDFERLNDRFVELKADHPTWHALGREAAMGYDTFEGDVDVVASVANVFPFFFILIGVLMTSNSMARMISEERGELGTLSSLGYSNGRIVGTYMLYVLSATGLGAVSGFMLGCSIIPPLIFSNFPYVMPPLVLKYDGIMFLIILVITLVIMSAVTLAACYKELSNRPARLMRPRPPRQGRKIILERMGFIWKYLSFTWKVTVRNMFRYKKRAFMTVVGVAGCASFLLVGFGLRDSMNGIVNVQYGDIFKYDNMLVLKSGVVEMTDELGNLFEKEGLEKPLLLRQYAVKCEYEKEAPDAYIIVPNDNELFYEYYHLTDKGTGEALRMGGEGAIVSQKIAEIFELEAGDSFTVKDAENKKYEITVSGISENYLFNYIFMEDIVYENVFGTAPEYNAVVSGFSGDKTALSKNLIDSGKVFNITYKSDIKQKALDGNKSLDGIIVLLVVVASMLAVIVLYNLTSINISERRREIATLKVIGFRDGETNSYIYHEAIILTVISVAIGMFLGVALHRFVIAVIEGTSRVFFKDIHWLSFVVSSAMTMVFAAFMQVITYFKLKTVDMIDSLKSVE